MPKLVGSIKNVVKYEGLSIDELQGNVATSDDTISVAYVTISEPTSEPWLTLDYDEWICMRSGYMELHYEEKGCEEIQVLTLLGGDTAFIKKGERFRPMFPKGDTEYIPVCCPAFRPDRCHREEEGDMSDVAKKLQDLHGGVENVTSSSAKPVVSDSTDKDALYHMCEKKLWEDAMQSGRAYYPPTFHEDGGFTHATAVPKRLLETANHFYTKVEGDWICLRLSRKVLVETCGIIIKDEGGLPVGDSPISKNWETNQWICPHIFGGIPTRKELAVVQETYNMVRNNDGTFASIASLTD